MGAVTTLMALEKGLSFGYGRDLQEDKRPIFEAFECAFVSLYALTGAIATADGVVIAARGARSGPPVRHRFGRFLGAAGLLTR